jgi:hypothetical protein
MNAPRDNLWALAGLPTFEQVDVSVRSGMSLGRGGGSEALSGSEAFFFGDGLWIGFTDGEVVGFTGVVLEAAILI